MFWYLSPKDKCAVCVWLVGCLGRTAYWRIREQSAVPIRQSSQTGKPDFPILSIWFMFSILQKSLHSSPFLPNPLCLSAFREVKSSQQLFTSAIALFIGIPEGLVKSEEYFRVCFCSFAYYLSKYVSMAMRGMFSIQSWSTYPFMEMRNPFSPGLSLMNWASFFVGGGWLCCFLRWKIICIIY